MLDSGNDKHLSSYLPVLQLILNFLSAPTSFLVLGPVTRTPPAQSGSQIQSQQSTLPQEVRQLVSASTVEEETEVSCLSVSALCYYVFVSFQV